MRHAAYLSASRHGIFYFRMPIPELLHPSHKSADLKLSLGTRCPKVASTLARLLIVTGQSLLAQPTVQAMIYPEIRMHVQNHFRQRLIKFKARVADAGPRDDDRLKALRDVIQAAERDLGTFVNLTHIGDEDRLLSDFCEKEGKSEELSPNDRQLVLRTYQQAYLQHAKTALDYNDSQRPCLRDPNTGGGGDDITATANDKLIDIAPDPDVTVAIGNRDRVIVGFVAHQGL